MSELVVWKGTDAWRSEVAVVELDDGGAAATGTQVGLDPLPYRLDYTLDATRGFVTRRLRIDVTGSGWRRSLDLRSDGRGSWQIGADQDGDAPDLPAPGGPTEQLAGALDCDLGLSPLTNTLPIRRAGLHRGPGAHDFLMVWVSVPDLAVLASPQRYEHVRLTAPGSVVRFVDRGLFPGFTAELELDDDAIVRRYPDLADRVG